MNSLNAHNATWTCVGVCVQGADGIEYLKVPLDDNTLEDFLKKMSDDSQSCLTLYCTVALGGQAFIQYLNFAV